MVNLLEFDDESTVVEQEPTAGSSRISRLTQELASMPWEEKQQLAEAISAFRSSPQNRKLTETGPDRD
jgi:hypothetical protein